MSAIEEPGSSSEPGGPAQPGDELEDWLSDLRTEVSADQPGWINKDAPPSRPADREVSDAPAPSGGGRHRAPD